MAETEGRYADVALLAPPVEMVLLRIHRMEGTGHQVELQHLQSGPALAEIHD